MRSAGRRSSAGRARRHRQRHRNRQRTPGLSGWPTATSTGAAAPAPLRPTRRRPHPLDAIAVALAAIGAGCVATGLLPRPEAAAVLGRILPLLIFLGTVVVLAELTAAAGVFDVLATRRPAARRTRPRPGNGDVAAYPAHPRSAAGDWRTAGRRSFQARRTGSCNSVTPLSASSGQ
ncbi:hypothetical protein [Micromonospora sp. C95]|uniref:hypothetical protein n=1 Tax=Micromonospora sp. C95 TaxID=2824882 RepID=UPI00265735CC|nr:hypothetical protein [Micromonospora sp. C95]